MLGNDELILTFARNVTEFLLFQDEQNLYNTIIQYLPGLFYIFEADNLKILRKNDYWSEFTGYSDKEIDSMTALDFMEDDTAKKRCLAAMKKTFLEGSGTLDINIVRKDGRKIPCFFIAHKVIVCGIPYLIGTGTDISGIKKTENAIRQSESVYRNLFDNAGVGMYRSNLNGTRFISVNQKITEIIGLSKDEVLAIPINSLWESESERIEFKKRLQREGAVYNYEIRVKDALNSVKTLLISGTVMKDKGWFEGAVIDITDRKMAEDEVKKHLRKINQINKKLEDYTYTVSHDLKEPIRSIRTFSEFIKEDYEDLFDDEAKDYLQRIINASEKMSFMINDMLTLSKVGRLDVELVKVDLKLLFEEVEETMYQRITESGTVVEIAPMPHILCQPVWIKSVFQNLITNSIKYNDKENKCIKISAVEKEKEVEFSVTDNGVGIAEEYQERVFGLFRQVCHNGKSDGSGAGLAIVQSVIEEHSGRIWVDESTLGKGTTIKFTICKNL